MKANAKKATDFPSRATLTAVTEGARDSERGKVVVEKRPHPMQPSTVEGRAALSYADIGFFFVFVFFLAMMLRIGVHLHVLRQSGLDNLTLLFQITISLSLIGSCTQSFDSGTDAASGSVWDGVGPLEFILLPPWWAESGLELGSTSLLVPRLQPLT